MAGTKMCRKPTENSMYSKFVSTMCHRFRLVGLHLRRKWRWLKF